MDTYDILLYGSYALIGLGAVLAILLPLFKSLDDPKSLLKTAAGIVGIFVLFLLLIQFQAVKFYQNLKQSLLT